MEKKRKEERRREVVTQLLQLILLRVLKVDKHSTLKESKAL